MQYVDHCCMPGGLYKPELPGSMQGVVRQRRSATLVQLVRGDTDTTNTNNTLSQMVGKTKQMVGQTKIIPSLRRYLWSANGLVLTPSELHPWLLGKNTWK